MDINQFICPIIFRRGKHGYTANEYLINLFKAVKRLCTIRNTGLVVTRVRLESSQMIAQWHAHSSRTNLRDVY